MASLTGSKGAFSIQWYDGSKRPTLYLGKVPKGFAKDACRAVGKLLDAAKYQESVDGITREWLLATSKTHPKVLKKLEAKGLLAADQVAAFVVTLPVPLPVTEAAAADPARIVGTTIGALCDYFIALKSTDKADNTVAKYQDGKANLVGYFTADRRTDSITAGDADLFRDWLRREGNRLTGGPLALTTVTNRCKLASQFFEAAERRGWIAKNPFADMRGWHTVGDSHEWVDAQTVNELIASTTDLELRLTIALARYGGLRIPSELRELRWEWWNPDPKAPTLTILAPKTKRFLNRKWKQLPVFPEIEPHLTALYDAAPEGSEYVFSRFREITSAAIRGRFERLCLRQGVALWGDMWMSMRSTRYTELLDSGFPEHVVTKWLGHCKRIAQKHYGQVTKDHVSRAANFRTVTEPIEPGSPVKPSSGSNPGSGPNSGADAAAADTLR